MMRPLSIPPTAVGSTADVSSVQSGADRNLQNSSSSCQGTKESLQSTYTELASGFAQDPSKYVRSIL